MESTEKISTPDTSSRPPLSPLKSFTEVCRKVWLFYYEGFRDMTVGKTLWAIMLIKLFIMFAVLKCFFFPNLLKENFDNDKDRASHVRQELTTRGK